MLVERVRNAGRNLRRQRDLRLLLHLLHTLFELADAIQVVVEARAVSGADRAEEPGCVLCNGVEHTALSAPCFGAVAPVAEQALEQHARVVLHRERVIAVAVKRPQA